MFENLKSEKGYIDGEFIGGCAIVIFLILLIVGFLVMVFGNFCLDFESGSHKIIPTAVDNDMWGNYKVYYRTTEYTKNSEEDYYYIEKNNTKLADQMKECIKQDKVVIVYYDKWVGFKGFTAPSEAPITKIEPIEK